MPFLTISKGAREKHVSSGVPNSFFARFALALFLSGLFSCASRTGLRSRMPDWWNRPSSDDSVMALFYSQEIGKNSLSEFSDMERDGLIADAISDARSRVSVFYGADVLPDDLFSVTREAIAESESGRVYAAKVEVSRPRMLELNPDVRRRMETAEAQAMAHYHNAVDFYEEYEDAKAIKEMFIAAREAHEGRVTSGRFSSERLIATASNMLSKISLERSELNDDLECEISVKRDGNIVREGINGAVIRMTVMSEGGELMHRADYVTDARGLLSTVRTRYSVSGKCRIEYALELDLPSGSEELGEESEAFREFFSILSDKRLFAQSENPQREGAYAVLCFVRDGNSVLTMPQDSLDGLRRASGPFSGLDFIDLDSEVDDAASIAMICESDPSLAGSALVLASSLITDFQSVLDEGVFFLHGILDLVLYDCRDRETVKILSGLECSGMGIDRNAAREDMMRNLAGMLGRYASELFGRRLSNRI